MTKRYVKTTYDGTPIGGAGDLTPQQLLDFRARHKLSQRAAAKRTGTAYGSWHNWEKGKTAVDAGIV
jgi:DNA-binding transcriptional regulator YiaG